MDDRTSSRTDTDNQTGVVASRIRIHRSSIPIPDDLRAIRSGNFGPCEEHRVSENSITKEQAEKLPTEQLAGKIVLGKFVEKRLLTLEDTYLEMEKQVAVGKAG